MEKLPKVELHRHLDGSLRRDTVLDLARHHKIDLGLNPKLTLKEPMKSLDEVLNTFWTTQKVMVSFEAMKRVTFENIEDAFHDGVKLIELRFAPLFIQKGKNLGFDEIIEGVIAGVTEGMNKYNVQVGLLHIMPRSLDLTENLKASEEIIRYQKSRIKNADRLIGFDLADSETEESFKDYLPIIERARNLGFGITIHSGEDTSALHVKRTLETFKATRIGHGVQIAKDPEVIKLVKDMDVVLEVCPTSNWLTHIVPSLDKHPLRQLYDAGVKVTLNSDDPHIMNISLMSEYEVAAKHLGFEMKEFVQMNKWALEKSFIPQDIKNDLKKNFSEFR